MDGELADTTTVPATLELRDEEGNAFTPQYTSMESDSANVTLTVYQVRELPLKVDFIGTPNGLRRREPALFAEPADPARGRSCPHDQRLGGPDRDGL